MHRETGQSLIEVVISVAVAGIVIGGAAILIAVSLRGSVSSKFLHAASFVNAELLDKVTVVGERDWHMLYDLMRGVEYYIATTTSGDFMVIFRTPLTPKVVTLDGTQYESFFKMFYATRTNQGIGNIHPPTSIFFPPGLREDPSTQRVRVTTRWVAPQGGVNEITFEKYLTRRRSVVFRQTDWSGSSTLPAAPYDVLLSASTTPTFATSSAIDFRSIPGTIRIAP